jgi:hypothetical protein
MKVVALRWGLLMAALLINVPAHAAGWFVCGNLSQIGWSCQLANYPSGQYEYGIAYNSQEPMDVTCSYWNYGMRVYNKLPYVIDSDNPQGGARWGGFMFYTNTLATDDDTCTGGSWRHKYWRLDVNNALTTIWSNGCSGSDLPIYCRAR